MLNRVEGHGILSILPWLIIIGQIVLMSRVLRSSPLKLSFPDMFFVAGSSVSRAALVTMAFLKTTGIALLICLPLMSFVAIALAHPLGSTIVNQGGFPAALMTLPIVLVVCVLAWLAGVGRLALLPVLNRRWSWLLPVLLMPVAYALQDVLLAPGRALAQAVGGEISAPMLVAMLIVTLLGIIAMVWLGRRTHMPFVYDESREHARLNALGMMAFMNRDLVRQIKAETSAGRTAPRLALPQARGIWALVAKSGLAYVRKPSLLVSTLIGVSVTALGAAWVIGTAQPIQVWFIWLVFIIGVPPKSLVASYESNQREPFLRQFIPFGNLQLLVGGTALPLVIFLVFAGGISLLLPDLGVASLTMLSAGVAFVLLQTICLGLASTRVSLLMWRPPYVWLAVFFLGLPLVVSSLTGSSAAALGVAVLLTIVAAALLASSETQDVSLE